jgi:hypothetical protein
VPTTSHQHLFVPADGADLAWLGARTDADFIVVKSQRVLQEVCKVCCTLRCIALRCTWRRKVLPQGTWRRKVLPMGFWGTKNLPRGGKQKWCYEFKNFILFNCWWGLPSALLRACSLSLTKTQSDFEASCCHPEAVYPELVYPEALEGKGRAYNCKKTIK